MGRIFRGLIIFGVACMLMVGSVGVALAASVVTAGVITVKITEHSPDGVDLYIPVPAAVIDFALATLPMLMPREELAEVRREVAPFVPALTEVAREFERMPSVVLVEVETDSEHVQVIKDGRDLEIYVTSADADIEVTVPAHLLSRVVGLLAG